MGLSRIYRAVVSCFRLAVRLRRASTTLFNIISLIYMNTMPGPEIYNMITYMTGKTGNYMGKNGLFSGRIRSRPGERDFAKF